MERAMKIKILEAIASGDISSIARRLPAIYVSKFGDRNALQDDVKTKYGPTARMFITNGNVMVVTQMPGFWILYEQEDGSFRDGNLLYTREQYEILATELESSSNLEWLEVRPVMVTYKRQPGNEPIKQNE